MARSSGGGSRSGGSRSSSGGSRGSSRGSRGNGITTSKAPFPGSRKFRYFRNGQTHYVYSNVDLTQVPDAKPRWFLIFFYLPFIFAIVSMFGGLISFPQKPMKTLIKENIAIIDKCEVFNSSEEEKLSELLIEFCETTGVTTQILTIDYDEWANNSSLEEYAYYRYYAQFEDENSWLLIYSEKDNGYGDWAWEGVQGDNTVKTMDVFLEDFNTTLHSSFLISDAPLVAASFAKAFNKAIDLFKNQSITVNIEMVFPLLFMVPFIGFHSYIMIFAGTRKKYSNKDLQEVHDEYVSDHPENNVSLTCPYCSFQYYKSEDNRCPNCGALINH